MPDPLERLNCYQMARRAVSIGREDSTLLAADVRTRLVASQLLRAFGSVAANIAEGYSRSSGPDRARFFEYALGSARESREWYNVARSVLPDAAVAARLAVLDTVVAQLVGLVRGTRGRTFRRDEDRPTGSEP